MHEPQTSGLGVHATVDLQGQTEFQRDAWEGTSVQKEWCDRKAAFFISIFGRATGLPQFWFTVPHADTRKSLNVASAKLNIKLM